MSESLYTQISVEDIVEPNRSVRSVEFCYLGKCVIRSQRPPYLAVTNADFCLMCGRYPKCSRNIQIYRTRLRFVVFKPLKKCGPQTFFQPEAPTQNILEMVTCQRAYPKRDNILLSKHHSRRRAYLRSKKQSRIRLIDGSER